MARDTPPPAGRDAHKERVAIVGGGAAGTLIALQLAKSHIASTMLDRHGAFARGVAYSATAPWHRLNVPIDKMGGWSADEDDRGFHDWYVANRGPLSERYADRYVARADYGAWLRAELDRVAATGLVELRAAGYAPFVVAAQVGGKGMFYRVRLGSYASYDDAVKAKGDFERKVSRIAYVTKL